MSNQLVQIVIAGSKCEIWKVADLKKKHTRCSCYLDNTIESGKANLSTRRWMWRCLVVEVIAAVEGLGLDDQNHIIRSWKLLGHLRWVAEVPMRSLRPRLFDLFDDLDLESQKVQMNRWSIRPYWSDGLNDLVAIYTNSQGLCTTACLHPAAQRFKNFKITPTTTCRQSQLNMLLVCFYDHSCTVGKTLVAPRSTRGEGHPILSSSPIWRRRGSDRVPLSLPRQLGDQRHQSLLSIPNAGTLLTLCHGCSHLDVAARKSGAMFHCWKSKLCPVIFNDFFFWVTKSV